MKIRLMLSKIVGSITLVLTLWSCTGTENNSTDLPLLRVSDNNRYFQTQDGDPFFWLGDTGWLLFKKLDREDAEKYLLDRKQKGFNVIQAMVIHNVQNTMNVYGDSALSGMNVSQPILTDGSSFEDPEQYDFWDHVDFIIDKAAENGIYMALVPVWGSNVKAGLVSLEEGKTFASFLAERYKNHQNIIWLNGGDINGSDSLQIWNAMGHTLNEVDTNHLITFHPRGRTTSSWWFHEEPWLDFNMFQSGHRNYDQDDTEHNYGEDNWRFVEGDYNMDPIKPTLDGEPSYEQIPQGLHDPANPYWDENDLRRYAYWSVFAGACGFTYGHNAVMQFFKETETKGAFGVKHTWQEGLNHPGASQMIHLKDLILSKPYLERIPDQSLVAGENQERYERIIATRGNSFAMLYSYTGRNFSVNMGIIEGTSVKALWFNPKDGSYSEISDYNNEGVVDFNPPGEPENGNDWVLVLDSI